MKETFNAFVRFSTLSKNVIKIDFMAIWVLSGRMIVLTKQSSDVSSLTSFNSTKTLIFLQLQFIRLHVY